MNLDTQTENRQTDAESEFKKAVPRQPKNLKLIFKLLIGLGAAVVASGILLIVPIIGLLTILFVFLSVLVGLAVYGLCDWQGLGAYVIALEILSILPGGAVFGCALLLYLALPLALMVYLDMRGTAFFKRMYLSLAIELTGMILALGLIVLIYRQNIGDLVTQSLKQSFAALPDVFKDSMAEFYKLFYSLTGASLMYETSDELLFAVAELCGETVRLGLPSMLLVLASFNVLPGVKIASGIRVRRAIPGASVEPLSKWRMPRDFAIGVIVLLLIGLLSYWTLDGRGEVVLTAMLTLASLAATVQALASFADRFGKAPVARGLKIAMAVMIALFLTQLIPYYGFMSMLVGSQGLITQWIRKRNEKRQGPDEPF